MIRAFISYARQDETLVKSLTDYLENNQISCFIDKRDILPATKYSEEIIKGIENSDFVVLILTTKSNKSQNVVSEIDNACNLKKKVVVFRVENIALSKDLQYYLSTSQWFDAFLFRPELYFEQLANYLKGLPIPPLSKKIILTRKIWNQFITIYSLLFTLCFVFFGIPILKDYLIVDKSNSRNIRFIDAIKRANLIDIEPKTWDSTKKNIAPPLELYAQAKREIFISGVTLRTTLEEHREQLREALRRGVQIKLLLLSPTSPDSTIVNYINNRGQSFANSIEGSLSIIKSDSNFFKNKNVEVRFAKMLPSLVGIMIDGDVDKETIPNENGGMIRVNPYFRSKLHDDWFFQFSNSIQPNDAFTDFAKEFRYFWKSSTP